MKRVLSTHVIVNHRLSTSWLAKASELGVEGVEIFCALQHIDWRNKSQIDELGHWFRDNPLKLHSLHSPMYTDEIWGRSGPHSHINITARDKATRLHWVGEIKRAIEIAETIPCKYLVQHIGAGGQEYKDESIEFAFTSLEELSIFARQRGVEILLENIPNELSSAQRLHEFNAQTHLNLNYVFDTGHAHIGAGVENEFEIMKARIRSLHIHDNDGTADTHLFPGRGTIDWSRTMELLRAGLSTTQKPGQYPLLLELREVAGMEHPMMEIDKIFEYLETVQPTEASTNA